MKFKTLVTTIIAFYIIQMSTVLFLQSNEANPYKLYHEQLLKSSVYRDTVQSIIAVYGYADCLNILNCPAVGIPPQNNTGLNEHALLIAGNLARFRNIPDHAIAKKAARDLYQHLQPVSTKKLLSALLTRHPVKEVDFVKQVSRQLPVYHILKGFNFNEEDCEFLAGTINALVKIMQPNKTGEMVDQINHIAKSCFEVISNHIVKTTALNGIVNNLCAEFLCDKEDALTICTANLAGLMMQGYDACSGLLSNAILDYLSNRQACGDINTNDTACLQKYVVEILRYDPPVHNTRRITTENFMLNGIEISKGENLLLVLAAANRDENQFSKAHSFDMERSNNQSQLTFGTGMHACLASQFATNMAVQVLHYFFSLFPDAKLLTDRVAYEPIINARLPVSLHLSLTKI
jgi:cytochrome P450